MFAKGIVTNTAYNNCSKLQLQHNFYFSMQITLVRFKIQHHLMDISLYINECNWLSSGENVSLQTKCSRAELSIAARFVYGKSQNEL